MVTDTAAEVVQLCKRFKEMRESGSSDSVPGVISKDFEEKNIGKFIDIYNERINDLLYSIMAINVDYVDEEVKSDALDSASYLLMLFNADRIPIPWHRNVDEIISRDVILSIRGVSPVLRQISPINKLSEVDLDEINKYVELDVSMKIASSNIPNFIKYSLVSGVDRLRFIVKYHDVFGSGSVLGTAYNISKDIAVAERRAPEQAKEVLGDLKVGLAAAVKKIRCVNDGVDLIASVVDKADALIDAFR